MPKDIVVVTAYWRHLYVKQCLETLADCLGIENKEVWVFQDDRACLSPFRRSLHTETTRQIIESGKYSRFVRRAPHDYDTSGQGPNHPCSFNVFSALQEAYAANAEFVYLVADDILVTPDFFKWSEEVHHDGDYFSTVAERVYNDLIQEPKPFDLSAYYQAPTSLMDAGMCWRREKLNLLLADGQVRDHRFPPNLTEKEFRPMIPFVQRAYHIGEMSTHIAGDKLHGRGDCDAIPKTMPQYKWDKVYRVE